MKTHGRRKELTLQNSMHIYIPSLSRADRQFTVGNLPKSWRRRTHIVVTENEYDEYQELHGDMVISTPVTGIAETRQWILENAESRYVLFLDDDMSFSYRYSGTKMKKSSPKEVKKMLSLLEEWLSEGFVHVGISARGGNNRVEAEYTEITRMNNSYAYNVEKYLKTGIRFDRLKVMEDFDVTLSLLEKGFPNRVTYQYAWGQRKSGDAGGCSLYRTAEVQKKAAHALSKLHPGLVKVIQKECKKVWTGIDSKYRTDVIISWKKAYKPKRQKNRGIAKFL